MKRLAKERTEPALGDVAHFPAIGVTGHEYDLEIRPARLELDRELVTAHLRHHHVGHEHVDGLALRHLERDLAVLCLEDAIAEARELAREETSNCALVLDEKDELGTGPRLSVDQVSAIEREAEALRNALGWNNEPATGTG